MESGQSSSSPEDPDLGSAVLRPTDEELSQYLEAWPPTEAFPLGESSAETAAAVAAAVKKEKGRVRFNSNAAAANKPTTPPHIPVFQVPDRRTSPAPKPRPSALRNPSSGSVPTTTTFNRDASSQDGEDDFEKEVSAVAAQERARKVADKVQRGSPTHSRTSFDSHHDPHRDHFESPPHDGGIPLQNLATPETSSRDDWHLLQSNDEDDAQPDHDNKDAAHDLVRAHTYRNANKSSDSMTVVGNDEAAAGSSSQVVPSDINNGYYDGVYNVPAPERYRGGVLSQLLKLYKPSEIAQMRGHARNRSTSSTGGHTSGSESGSATPSRRKWYEQNRSQETLANLIEASARLANPNTPDQNKKKNRPKTKRQSSGNWQKEEVRITVHIAETLARQGYIIKLCKALMLFGAPTHRLEEYLSMSARVLEIEGQFLYLPGCMIISFDDMSTHTTEVKIVRAVQGIDLGKLKDVHHIYKEVMHDVIGVEEGTQRLDVVMKAKQKYPAWVRVIVFGLTSATCAPFSFKARLIDLPLTFCFGCIVGGLQLIVAPKSNLYSNVFEVTATVLVSFMARAFGSIADGKLFCFSSMAQGGIVMLLPGYSVLCSSLELQSRAIVPGSIRIVYAIIYSLLLGFGITVGASLWGLFDNNATSEVSCKDPLGPQLGFIFVPFFIICISILYQAKWRQMPVMVVIAFTGYIVNYFSSIKFVASPQIANTLGALAVGVLANLYSRIRHGVAAATLIPAIFVQVPGGLASTGGLLSGLRTANMLTNSTKTVNGTAPTAGEAASATSTVVFDVAASMIQIAIGIAVGLFMSALIIYPLGKRRSGLFSF